MRKTNPIVFIILIFFIVITTIMPAFANESQTKVIYISNAEDLIQLSEDSSIDNWSQGITVFLNNDINLKDIDFTPIPIFSGTFDGQGYSIRGLSVTVEGANQGLFRYLQKGGVIKNLRIQGIISPKGEKSTIGGIVGNNQGTLENCSFSGFIKGKDTVGGLVGWNGSSGIIINSSFNGAIYGESKVGGIVGYNSGTTLRCSNLSNVNTTVEDQKLGLEDISDITIDNINLTQLVTDAIDIGGIAGVNSGIIQSSENHGKVGYPHVGYNVGGIVGRQSGYITKCVNYGNVYGRKEVAGIVGQIEPHISTIIGSSQLDKLQKELNALDSTITNMINNTKDISDTITQNLASIQDNIDDSKTHAQSLIDQTEIMIDDNIEELDKISVIGAEALDRLIPIAETLENTIETMGEAIKLMDKAMQYISGIMKESSFLGNKFKEMSASMEDSINRMLETQEKLKKARLDITSAMKLLKRGQTDGVLELLQSAFKNIKEVKLSFKKAIINFDPRSTIEEIFDEIKVLTESGDYVGDSLNYALDYMIRAMDLMEDVIVDIEDVFDGFTNLFTFVTEQEGLEFATTNDLYEKTAEDLYGSINDISGSLSEFIKDMTTSGNILMDDMQSISDQLFRLMNLMINIIEEISIGDISEEDILKDVSSENIEKKTEGKVSDCNNRGIIEGDINVGGIAGGMSIELKLDPEIDLDLKGKLSYNTVFETRAIIHRCKNEGNIISKKNSVGGIVGSMDLGYIKDCIVSGSIESLDGNYVGGIAGKSDAPIVSSYVKCTLDGGNYIGGISGYGKEITDSYTLVQVGRSRACVGAIAGNINENSNIKFNYFLSDSLRGIDGISYINKAEPITYEELISIESLPNIFKDFKLSFWVDGKIIKTMILNYGDTISHKDFPEIPLKEKYYSKWDTLNIENFTFDTDIHAIYSPYLTILESKEKRDGPLSIVLVEGSFTDQDSLALIEDKSQGPVLAKNGTQLEQWSVSIPEDGESMHNIRYLPQEVKKNLEVYILTNGKWKKTKSKWDGKYLVFKASGNNIAFSIVDSGFAYIEYVILIFISILLIIILIIYISWFKKTRTKNKSNTKS